MTEYGSSPNCVFSASSRRTSENTPSRHFGEKAGAGRVVSIYEYPRSLLLGNPAYLTREEGWSAAAKARREEGSTTSTMMRTANTSPTAITPFSAPGAKTTPGAPKRKLSTQTTMVAHKLHFCIIHNPTETTRPTMPSTIPE